MFDIHQPAFDEESQWDDDLTSAYNDNVVEQFAQSPEGIAVKQDHGRLGWSHSFINYGLSYLGETPPEMSVSSFNEIVFEIFPRKVSVEADRAGDIIRELRAFWQFLGRQYELPNAAAIVDSLDDEAEQELEEALSDPSNFGMAKSMVMMGNEAGFDMTTEEGMNAFMVAYNASILGARDPAAQARDVAEVEVPQEGSTRFERSQSTRIGRNESCPCGSGKKYKKCCGRK